MALATIQVPKNYSGVIFVALGSFLLLEGLGGLVVSARKKYKVEYPTMYANPADNKFAKEL